MERGVPPAWHAEYPLDVPGYIRVTRHDGVTEEMVRRIDAAAKVLLPSCVTLSWHEPTATNETVKLPSPAPAVTVQTLVVLLATLTGSPEEAAAVTVEALFT